MNRRLVILFLLLILINSCRNAGNSDIDVAPERSTHIRFDDGTAASGISFTHIPSRTDDKWLPEVMGSGLAIADLNRDGAPDIILVNSGKYREEQRPDNAKTRLYINDGKGSFQDRTDEWGLTSTGYGMGVAIGDIDNDGWNDVFLTSSDGNNRLFRNSGSALTDVTATSGLRSDGKWATSAAFLDIDNDGDLDLCLVRYIEYSESTAVKNYHNRIRIYEPPYAYEGVQDQLWINDGNGKFSDATRSFGFDGSKGKGLALAAGDIDKDGDIDVYVSNDTKPNQLWINDSTGRFQDIAQLAGCAYDETGREQGDMGADFTDIDGDGLLDIVDTTFQTEPLAIYRQRAPLIFDEISDLVGVGVSSRARLKFGIDAFDTDNDGDEDLMVANGHIEDNINLNSETVTFPQQNSLYENTGGKFADVSNISGDALLDKQVSRGLATGDLNGDGLLDFVVSNNGGTAQIGLNATTEHGSFIILWLEGVKANRSSIGTRVVAKIGDRTIERQVMGAQSYLSVSDFRLHFGLGPADKIDELTIYWPGRESQTIMSLSGGKFYFIRQGEDPLEFRPGEKQIL